MANNPHVDEPKSSPRRHSKTAAMQRNMANLQKDITPIGSTEMLDYIETSRLGSNVTVKFVTKDMEVFTQSYYVTMSIGEVKQVLQKVFNFPKCNMQLTMDGLELDDETELSKFDAGKYSLLEFSLSSKDPNRHISAKYAYKDLSVPDIITVTVTYDDGSVELVTVEIENKCILKPFLGGYLNKITQIEYHDGFSQSGPPKPKIPVEMRTHRDTQTYWMRNRKEDTSYSSATQMSNQEIYIPSVNDRIIVAKPYETADERAARLDIEGKVRIIQRYFRAWKLRKALKVLCEEYRKRIRLEKEEEGYLLRMDAERKNRELIAKVFPRTKADFYMLYTMLENWKKAELERIKAKSCGPSRIAEMYLLLEKEVEMLVSIENQKEIVKRDRKIKKDIDFLKTISEPLAWNSDYKNIFIEMDTLETQQGREYYEIYKQICDRNLPTEDKLKLYLDIKMSLADHTSCEVGIKLANLLDRIMVLITRGITGSHLENLQKRIEATYLHHLHMPTCCEGVVLRSERVKEKLMTDMFYCERCKAFKNQTEFDMNANTKAVNVCMHCAWSDRVMEPWMDIHPYRYLLKCIRREERRQSSHSSIAFILTDKDIYHIISQIWQSHSAINECDDIYKLRLCRFFKDCDWAPWNCILLTYEETKAHLKVKSVVEVYDQEFLKHIYNKHMTSKRYYKQVFKLDQYFQDIGEIESRWDEIIDKKEFVAVNSKMKIFLNCH